MGAIYKNDDPVEQRRKWCQMKADAIDAEFEVVEEGEQECLPAPDESDTL